mgnify:CR=1 FL=1
MKNTGVRVVVAMAIVCVLAGVMFVVPSAATNQKCRPGQIDVGLDELLGKVA